MHSTDNLCRIELPIEGKKAISKFEVIQSREGNRKLSLVKLELITGRKHQLRIHCSSGLNCAILGDKKYGNPNVRH
jgi:23S rRNA-/tRNA-specific pseudouridylate synthase